MCHAEVAFKINVQLHAVEDTGTTTAAPVEDDSATRRGAVDSEVQGAIAVRTDGSRPLQVEVRGAIEQDQTRPGARRRLGDDLALCAVPRGDGLPSDVPVMRQEELVLWTMRRLPE